MPQGNRGYYTDTASGMRNEGSQMPQEKPEKDYAGQHGTGKKRGDTHAMGGTRVVDMPCGNMNKGGY